MLLLMALACYRRHPRSPLPCEQRHHCRSFALLPSLPVGRSEAPPTPTASCCLIVACPPPTSATRTTAPRCCCAAPALPLLRRASSHHPFTAGHPPKSSCAVPHCLRPSLPHSILRKHQGDPVQLPDQPAYYIDLRPMPPPLFLSTRAMPL
jgi:hypothetical protein